MSRHPVSSAQCVEADVPPEVGRRIIIDFSGEMEGAVGVLARFGQAGTGLMLSGRESTDIAPHGAHDWHA
jgi:hypothetical protein